jgi:AcrR family transcriptional regulator
MENNKLPKTKKGMAAKKRIFKAALKLINSGGYDETTVKDICKAAKVATGTFYHYFESKQDIIIEYVKNESQDLEHFYKKLELTSGYDRFLAVLEYQLSYYDLKGKAFVKKLYEIDIMRNFEIIGFENYSLHRILAECVAEGQAAGEIRQEYDVMFITKLAVHSMLGHSYEWICYSAESLMDSSYEDLVRLMEMFLTPEARAARQPSTFHATTEKEIDELS